MNIALDIMSGDNPPHSMIKGAINFLNSHKTPDTVVTLYGSQKTLKQQQIKKQLLKDF